MQRAGLDALLPAFPQPVQMIVDRSLLQVAHALLLGQERAGRVHVIQHEHARRQMQVVEQMLVHFADFLEALRREREPLLDLLGGDGAQALVDNVADVLEIDGERQDVRAALAIHLAQLVAAADGGEMQLYGAVQPIQRIVHPGQLDQQFAVIGAQRLEKSPQHGFHNVDHA
jgi:hypothetical protein